MVYLTSWVALGHGDTIPSPCPMNQKFTKNLLTQERKAAKSLSNTEQTYLFLYTV